MDVLLVAGIILVAGLMFLGWFTKRYADFWFNILVSNKAELVNEILGSEELPVAWRLRWLERSSRFSFTHQLLKRWFLNRMDRLIRSVQHSSYINKDLKAEYVEALQGIRDEWHKRQDLF